MDHQINKSSEFVITVTPSSAYIPPNDEIYEMIKKPRGYCLIINNYESNDENVFAYRKGSVRDCKYLSDVFEQLNFKIKPKVNLKASDIRRECLKLSKNEKLLDHNALVVIILSHGKPDAVAGVDGHHVRLETIYTYFNNNQCQYLAGKPKMFFISACRGVNLDPIDENYLLNSDGNYNEGTWTHMIIVYSTINGYVSLRNEVNGTWFGYWLSHLLAEHAHDRHLNDILKKVSQAICSEVGYVETKNDGTVACKQGIQVDDRNFNKNLYFNPGL